MKKVEQFDYIGEVIGTDVMLSSLKSVRSALEKV